MMAGRRKKNPRRSRDPRTDVGKGRTLLQGDSAARSEIALDPPQRGREEEKVLHISEEAVAKQESGRKRRGRTSHLDGVPFNRS